MKYLGSQLACKNKTKFQYRVCVCVRACVFVCVRHLDDFSLGITEPKCLRLCKATSQHKWVGYSTRLLCHQWATRCGHATLLNSSNKHDKDIWSYRYTNHTTLCVNINFNTTYLQNLITHKTDDGNSNMCNHQRLAFLDAQFYCVHDTSTMHVQNCNHAYDLHLQQNHMLKEIKGNEWNDASQRVQLLAISYVQYIPYMTHHSSNMRYWEMWGALDTYTTHLLIAQAEPPPECLTQELMGNEVL